MVLQVLCLLIARQVQLLPSKTQLVLLGDWSYHHYITERLGRQPDRSEQPRLGERLQQWL